MKSINPLLNIEIVYCVCNEWFLLLMNLLNLKVKLLAKRIFIPKGRDGGKGRGGMRYPL